MTNPFDDPGGSYLTLVNSANQHSLWPVGLPVPEGWTAAHGPAGRDACLEYAAAHWTDLRPRIRPEPAGQPVRYLRDKGSTH
jgi:MbtH protein